MKAEIAFCERLKRVSVLMLARQEHLFEGQINDPANVMWANVGEGIWLRFFFDAGVFFWRQTAAVDVPTAEGENEWRLVELPVSGRVISAAFEGIEGGGLRVLSVKLERGSFQLRNEYDKNVLSLAVA